MNQLMWTKEQKREYNRKYRLEHSEQIKDYTKKWRLNHKEYHKEYMKQWKLNHEKYMKQYYLVHKNQMKSRQKQYNLNHKEERKQYSQEHKEHLKICHNQWLKEHPNFIKRFKAKRRNLGFIPLNKPFKGAEAHHIDFECIVFIPNELHRSVYHNVWTGQGMFEINDRVFEWLGFTENY